MKKVLAIAMAVAMLFSLALVSSAVDAPAFKLSASEVVNGEITVTLSAPTLASIKTLTSYIEFDKTVVEPIQTGVDDEEKPVYKGGAAGTEFQGNFYPNLSGAFVAGMQEDSDNKFGIGFMNPTSASITEGPKAIYNVTFKVLNAEAANTTFKFVISELVCDGYAISENVEADTLAATIKAAGPADPGPADPGPADPGPADPGPADPGPAAPGGDDDKNPNTGIVAGTGLALSVMFGAAVVALRKKED